MRCQSAQRLQLGHCAVPLVAAWLSCCKTRSERASSSIFLHHRQLSTLLLARPAALHSFGLRRAARPSPPASVPSFFSPSRCSISPIEPNLFALCFAPLGTAQLSPAQLCCALVLAIVSSLPRRLASKSPHESLRAIVLESLHQTPGTVRQGQLLCDSSLIQSISLSSLIRGFSISTTIVLLLSLAILRLLLLLSALLFLFLLGRNGDTESNNSPDIYYHGAARWQSARCLAFSHTSQHDTPCCVCHRQPIDTPTLRCQPRFSLRQPAVCICCRNRLHLQRQGRSHLHTSVFIASRSLGAVGLFVLCSGCCASRARAAAA